MGRHAILAMLVIAVLVGLAGCRQTADPTMTIAPMPPPAPIVQTPVPSTIPSYNTPMPFPTVARPMLPTATATTSAATMTAIAALPTCRAADLTIVEGNQNAGGGHFFWAYFVWNRGMMPCTLVGIPGVELLDANGAMVLALPLQAEAVDLSPWASELWRIVVLLPGLEMPIAHRDNGRGYAYIEFVSASRGPGAGECLPLAAPPKQMRFTLPATKETLLFEKSITTCDQTFVVSPFH